MVALLAFRRARASEYEAEHGGFGAESNGGSDSETGIPDLESKSTGKETSLKLLDKIFKQVVDAADIILYILDAQPAGISGCSWIPECWEIISYQHPSGWLTDRLSDRCQSRRHHQLTRSQARQNAQNGGSKDDQAHLILLSALQPKLIFDPVPEVTLLIRRLSTSRRLFEKLLRFYNLPPIVDTTATDLSTDFLMQVARRCGRPGKGGIPDM